MAKFRRAPCHLLRDRLEDDFGVFLVAPPQRIWGPADASCRWYAQGVDGKEYLSYHSMGACLKAGALMLHPSIQITSQVFVEISV